MFKPLTCVGSSDICELRLVPVGRTRWDGEWAIPADIADVGARLFRSAQKAASFSIGRVPTLRDAIVQLDRLPVTFDAEIGAVLAAICAANGPSQHIDRTVAEIGHFGLRVRFEGVQSLSGVTPAIVDRFVHEAILNRSGTSAEPAASTVQVRRGAVRELFRAARQLDLVEKIFDPTVDIDAPAKSSRRPRPLTDIEVDICRSYSHYTLNPTRSPAVWALAEATGTAAEIADVTLAGLDLAKSKVWFNGRHGRRRRYGSLTAWGRDELAAWTDLQGFEPSKRIVFRGSTTGQSGSASISADLSDTLKRAGLSQDPTVKPGSIAAWIAQTIYSNTSKSTDHTPQAIEDVAYALGVKSLDQIADIIGLDWYAERLAADG